MWLVASMPGARRLTPPCPATESLPVGSNAVGSGGNSGGSLSQSGARQAALDRQAHQRRFQRRLVRLESQFVPLLISVLLPVALLPVTAEPGGPYRVLLPLLFTVLILQSLRTLPLLAPNRAARILVTVQRLLGIGAIVALWMQVVGAQTASGPALRFVVPLLAASFSLLATARLVSLLARVPRVNARVMAGAAAGYVYLGISGGLVATAMQVLVPGSFQLGLSMRHEFLIDRLTYFSFVVLAGLGLGDVLPHNPFGERFVILLSLCGALYLALLMGLLIGRFIATQELEFEFDALVDELDDPTSPIAARMDTKAEQQESSVPMSDCDSP